jgi:hypothetical protein
MGDVVLVVLIFPAPSGKMLGHASPLSPERLHELTFVAVIVNVVVFPFCTSKGAPAILELAVENVVTVV